MSYSTGRGGAGNIHHSKNLTSENQEITPQLTVSKSPPPGAGAIPNEFSDLRPSKSQPGKKVYYSTGRGGAGNIRASDEVPSPKLYPQGSNTPHITTSKFSTGRGGFGNMVDNKDPQLSRKLQDVDGEELRDTSPELQAINSNKSFSVGRGGFGNVISKSRSHSSQGAGLGSDKEDVPNLYTVSSRGEKKHKQKKGGFLGKIKEYFNS
ncbi:conserved hypothetical protein [Lodderomyces elongisporus NRRL YB-4239]|uniref:Protein PAR32 n=1 Tax=Lodderomyces elongisporus (strain ATCC 11503 / CBS 2605 / JCM 1781 / NBRC 1676 / NRRL YB-4239) TaxID=379508 RepID=A5E2N3_LODEL|nr:conserved hypothetical protein [Lodderomyces elongisporus NRRL YB-4239]